MSNDKKKRGWDPIMHDHVDDQSDVGSDTGEEKCPMGGVHDMKEIDRSKFCPDGDPAWIKYQCTKCRATDTSS